MKGEFLGFTFNGVHSSNLNILRVSGGDRYQENLFPEFDDKSASVPGMDGEYYFGTNYGSREIEISIAFDSITEENFRRIRQVFSTKKICQLIFDESPYKAYLAKVKSPIELEYICFDEKIKTIGETQQNAGLRVIERTSITEEIDGEEIVIDYAITKESITPYVYSEGTHRVYKGEGKIEFICYFPFAKSVYKIIPARNSDIVSDWDWIDASRILDSENYQNFDKYKELDTDVWGFNVYNAGDVPTGFRIYCPFSAAQSLKISYIQNGDAVAHLNIETIVPETGDIGFLINTENGLIQGVSSFSDLQSGNVTYTTSGKLYNRYIESGYFFKIEPSSTIVNNDKIVITDIDNETIETTDSLRIFYDYLYF